MTTIPSLAMVPGEIEEGLSTPIRLSSYAAIPLSR